MPVLAILTDFGTQDGRAAKLIGTIKCVNPALEVCEIQNHVPRGDVGTASAFLYSSFTYFPAGAIIAVLVDAEGAPSRPLAALTHDRKLILTPDSGTLTIWKETHGLREVRCIENVDCPEGKNLYAYTEALLASGGLCYEELGGTVPISELRMLPLAPFHVEQSRVECGLQSVLKTFGNLNLSVSIDNFLKSGIADGDMTHIAICRAGTPVFDADVRYARSFGCVGAGEPVLFNGSTGYMGLSLNQQSFLEVYLSEILRDEAPLSDYTISIIKKGSV